jgi:branched-chain amino acid transport system ATP-binding protein
VSAAPAPGPAAEPAPEMALHVAGVTKSFGSLTVLRGVTFGIGAAETVGIVGPNGAGKTILLDVMTGTQRADAGRVWLRDRDVSRLGPPRRARLGLGRTFQIPRPLGQLTVFENALVGAVRAAGLRGQDAYQAAWAALELTGSQAHANAPAGSLRLLDRKRLELARALAMRPRVLLLDEIAGGLTDPETEVLVATIRRVVADGTTVVWVEHVIRALVQVATRLICLADGEIIADGDPAGVLDRGEVRAAYLGGAYLAGGML